MLTEKQIREWFDNIKKLYSYNDKNYIFVKKDMYEFIEDFINKGKELNYIRKTELEEVREIVKYYNENNPYEIKGKIELKDDKDFNERYRFGKPIIILIQDLNRIVTNYEKIIKELNKE